MGLFIPGPPAPWPLNRQADIFLSPLPMDDGGDKRLELRVLLIAAGELIWQAGHAEDGASSFKLV